MLQPRSLRSSSFITPLVRQTLPTGNGFGGSNLKIVRLQELVFPIVNSSLLIADRNLSSSTQQQSPLIIEVGKIFLLALWLWLSIGANFCFTSISSIASFSTPDV
jgi:hypothetical protein